MPARYLLFLLDVTFWWQTVIILFHFSLNSFSLILIAVSKYNFFFGRRHVVFDSLTCSQENLHLTVTLGGDVTELTFNLKSYHGVQVHFSAGTNRACIIHCLWYVFRALNNLLLLTLGSVWSVCRYRRYREHYQADVCWHDVLVLGQIQFWTQPAHQGKQTSHNTIYKSQLTITEYSTCYWHKVVIISSVVCNDLPSIQSSSPLDSSPRPDQVESR